MDNVDHTFLYSVEIIGYSEGGNVTLANHGHKGREAIRAKLSALLSLGSKAAVMELGPLGRVWVAFDGYWIRNRKHGHLNFSRDGVLFISYAKPDERDMLGEGNVLIVHNQAGRVLYSGRDGME